MKLGTMKAALQRSLADADAYFVIRRQWFDWDVFAEALQPIGYTNLRCLLIWMRFDCANSENGPKRANQYFW